MKTCAGCRERLTAIDSAQANIRRWRATWPGLQQILSNKQTRGAFGQQRMETIVADGLPQGAYIFQATLVERRAAGLHHPHANGQRRGGRRQFPLEAWNTLRSAQDEAV